MPVIANIRTETADGTATPHQKIIGDATLAERFAVAIIGTETAYGIVTYVSLFDSDTATSLGEWEH
jgi:hypothetical protein